MEKERFFINAKEAADLIGVSMPTFYLLCKVPGFPFFRIGKKILVYKEGLHEFFRLNIGMDILSQTKAGFDEVEDDCETGM